MTSKERVACRSTAVLLRSFLLVISVVVWFGVDLAADEATLVKTETKMSPKELFAAMAGQWEGTCQTWFEPGKLADESSVRGVFEPVLGGRFLRHRYEGMMQGKPRTGEELLAFNSVTKQFQSVWVDDFHMNYAILTSEGPPSEKGFAVTGKYDVGPDQPQWGWRTVFELKDERHLVITAYNISPEGQEAKAVETVYIRSRSE